MKDKLKRFLRPADLIVVAALLAAAAAALFFGRADGVTAEILCDREIVETVDLTAVKEPYDIRLENGVTVTVAPGSIRFADSDCANGLCLRAGALTKAGQSAACLPNKTLIRVKGRAKNAPDALTG